MQLFPPLLHSASTHCYDWQIFVQSGVFRSVDALRLANSAQQETNSFTNRWRKKRRRRRRIGKYFSLNLKIMVNESMNSFKIATMSDKVAVPRWWSVVDHAIPLPCDFSFLQGPLEQISLDIRCKRILAVRRLQWTLTCFLCLLQ